MCLTNPLANMTLDQLDSAIEAYRDLYSKVENWTKDQPTVSITLCAFDVRNVRPEQAATLAHNIKTIEKYVKTYYGLSVIARQPIPGTAFLFAVNPKDIEDHE